MKWPTVKLKSVTSKVGSGATPRGGEAVYKDAGVPLIRSMNVHFDGFRHDGLVYLDEEEASLLNHVEIQSNDVLFNITGASIGRVTTAPANMAGARVNQHVCILRPTDKLMPQFLSYYMRSSDQQVLVGNSQIGGTRQAVTKGMLLNWEIHLPPRAEQERLVRLLDKTDELRKLRTRANRRTVDLIPALFHEMFGDSDANQQGWARCPVSSFVEELQGGRSVKPAGADEAAGRFRVLKISAVTWGIFNPEESKPVPAIYEPPKSHFVREGDLLFSRANTSELVAATSYVFDTPPNLLLPDKLWRFVWKQPQVVDPLFVWWLFQSPSVRRELGQRATGTGGSMKNISKPKVMSLEVPLPPLPLQKEFSARASEIRAMQAEQAVSRCRLDDLFQSMLHRSFNGEL